jgi:nicotinamide riboside kinase
MEKRMEKRATHTHIVVITGPESTGKTELSKYLSAKTGYPWVPELSRSYIENLGRPYTFEDVEVIAHKQIDEFQRIIDKNHRVVIFDTDLIITKVWFDVVYKKCPNWVIEAIEQQNTRMHLLCNTDIPWVPDPVRENGGEMRNRLFEIYQNELAKFNIPYEIVHGTGDDRELTAYNLLKGKGII